MRQQKGGKLCWDSSKDQGFPDPPSYASQLHRDCLWLRCDAWHLFPCLCSVLLFSSAKKLVSGAGRMHGEQCHRAGLLSTKKRAPCMP